MNREFFALPAYAKINWFLHILGKRADDYHEICTALQTVSLHDELTFAHAADLILTCDDAAIPVDESNLIMRAAADLRARYDVRRGARIHLAKKIPSPGGLGGGSADAATALIGLARLWNLKLSIEELSEIGGKLGADVPFFFRGGTALGSGRGTEIEPVADAAENFLLIVTPPVAVSTAAAYAALDAPRLTSFDSKSIFEFCRTQAATLDWRQTNSKNDFETAIFARHPEIERVKRRLLEAGARYALMSGSGASVFGVFEKEETRQATIKALRNEPHWRMFAVATVTREQYRAALKMR